MQVKDTYYEEVKKVEFRITEFEVIKPTNEIESVGEKLKLSAFGEFCPDNSLRGYSIQFLLSSPENYRVSKVIRVQTTTETKTTEIF